MAKQYCVICCRPRKGHERPFGLKCVLPPLSEEERARNVELMRAVGEEPLSAELSPQRVPLPDEDEETEDEEEMMDELLKEREQLLKQQAEAAEALAKQEKAYKDKQEKEKKAQLKKELEELRKDVMAKMERMQYLTIASETPGEPANPVVQQDGPSGQQFPQGQAPLAVQPGQHVGVGARVKQGAALPAQQLPEPQAPSYSSVVRAGQAGAPGLDPALAVYAQAAAAAAGAAAPGNAATPGNVAAPVVPAVPAAPGQNGLQPQQYVQPPVDPPVNLVPAVAGGGAASAGRKSLQGKCLPEQFVLRPSEPVRDEDRVSYYEFVHGLLRFLFTRYVEEGRSIAEFIRYYVQLANLACQYRWSAVYNLHKALVNDMEWGNRKTWGEPIPSDVVQRFCNQNACLPDRSDRHSVQEVRGRRDSRRRRFRRESSSGGSARGRHSNGKVCYMYNNDSRGCSYGEDCKFDHICSNCKDESDPHPAKWCPKRGAGGKDNK